jgi:nitrile hydratase subunit alpha
MTTTEQGGSPPPVTGTFPAPPEEVVARVKALEAIFIEKGFVTEDAIDKIAEMYEKEVGPHLGAKVVARAWTDPDFKGRLLEDASEACREIGIAAGVQGEDMVVVENEPGVHNVIVCTLCSCYPWPTLGLPPNWYKYPAYRSRMVKEPRAVLRDEFDLDLPESTEIKVWDTSAELRYWVLPERPAGTEGMSEEELASLVTRDSMIGVGLSKQPGQAG